MRTKLLLEDLTLETKEMYRYHGKSEIKLREITIKCKWTESKETKKKI
jgi:hypothetical protein